MSSQFVLSQLLVCVAIGFDLLSFQFKQRRQIIACLIVSCLLVSIHFALLGLWTAAGLGALAALRFMTSYWTTSKKAMGLFILTSLTIGATTFHGLLSVLSCLGSVCGTIGSFCREDRRLRQVMMMATSLWLVHNWLAQTPLAVLLEVLFLGSNLLGYYRFYVRRAGRPDLLPTPPPRSDEPG